MPSTSISSSTLPKPPVSSLCSTIARAFFSPIPGSIPARSYTDAVLMSTVSVTCDALTPSAAAFSP